MIARLTLWDNIAASRTPLDVFSPTSPGLTTGAFIDSLSIGGHEIQASGVTSLRGIARALAARGVKTARGGDWSDGQVAAVLRR
jgi:hypothetical protein